MSIDNKQARADAYLKSVNGQYSLINQARLESSKSFNGLNQNRAKQILSELTDPENNKLMYSRQKIAGGYEDLNTKYDSIVNKLGAAKNQDRVEHVSDMRNLRAERVSRDALSDVNKGSRYRRTSLGLDSDLMSATTPSHGGGVAGTIKMPNFQTFKAAGAAHHANRALKFATGFNMGHDTLNAIGIATSHQKKVMRSANVGLFNKIATAGFIGVGAMYSASTIGDYITGREETTLSNNAAIGVLGAALSVSAGSQAFRIAKESTHALTSLVPKGKYRGTTAGKVASNLRGAAKMGAGVTVGLGAALGASALVDTGFSILRESANQNNSINRLKSKLYKSDYVGDLEVRTDQLQTARQRVMQKLSKSALNDRASLLGNEAMVLKGIL